MYFPKIIPPLLYNVSIMKYSKCELQAISFITKGGNCMTFGEKLSELLEERGMTQKEFAKTLNIAPTTLNGYIRDKRQPDFELIKRMSSALHVSVDLLLGGDGFELTAKELSLITKLRTLSEDQQKIVYALVNISAEEGKQRDL